MGVMRLVAIAILGILLAAFLAPPCILYPHSNPYPLPPSMEEWKAQGMFVNVTLPTSPPTSPLSVFVWRQKSTTGGGMPVFLVHGFPTSSYDYHKVAGEVLADPRVSEVVAFDFPGFGLSSKPGAGEFSYDLADQAEVFLAVAKTFGISRGGLVCHDMGDTICQEILAVWIERIESEHSPPPFTPLFAVFTNGGMVIELASFRLSQVLLRTRGVGTAFVQFVNYAVLSHQIRSITGPHMTEEDIECMWTSLMVNQGYATLPLSIDYINQRFARGSTRWLPALQTAISKHNLPVAFAWGKLDKVAPPAIGESLIASLPPSIPFTWIPDSGHFPMLETPQSLLHVILSTIPAM